MNAGKLQPDGTYCRTGPTCLRHGHLGALGNALRDIEGQTLPHIQGAGTSGHSIGSRVEDHVYRSLLNKPDMQNLHTAPGLLNDLFKANPMATTFQARNALLGQAPRDYLFGRSENATKAWTPQKKFQVKQNDTADLILLSGSLNNIQNAHLASLDVKSVRVGADIKKGQAPNIISSTKLFKATAALTKKNRQPDFSFVYVAVRWELNAADQQIKLLDTKLVDLFKIPPKDIYINWTAGTQIQFHPESVSQSYEGDPLSWCKEYQREFIAHHDLRLKKLQKAHQWYLTEVGLA